MTSFIGIREVFGDYLKSATIFVSIKSKTKSLFS